MRPLQPYLLLAGLFLFLPSCASGPSSRAGARDQNVISLAEIQATEAETALQIVQQLRPRWLVRNRGIRTFEEGEAAVLRVIVDDLPPREIDYLREIPKEALVEIRFLEPREATFLYGTGYGAGVVKVTTRR